MSPNAPNDFLLWRHVHLVSEAISHGAEHGTLDSAGLENHLTAIEEVFGSEMDPHKDFQVFVLLHLCRSIRRTLKQLK